MKNRIFSGILLFLSVSSAQASEFVDLFDETGYYDTFGSTPVVRTSAPAAKSSIQSGQDTWNTYEYYDSNGYNIYYGQMIDGVEWLFTMENGESEVSCPKGPAIPWSTADTLTVPDRLGNCPVTSIGNCAFQNCTGLTSVTIPNSVTSIGNCAFQNCTGLTSVIIPSSVASIGKDAFAGCPVALFDTTSIPGVKLVDSWVVGYTGNIPEAVELRGVRGIAAGAFSWCSSLTFVTIPDSVTSIGDYAFSDCTGLTSFSVGAGNPNFSSNNGLLLSKDGKTLIKGVNGNVTIPNSVTSIGDYAFSDCTGLTSVTIPNSVTSIGDWAFSRCTGLTFVTIPDSMTSIGNYAFYDCTGLTSVTIPNSVTSIGEDAFSRCTGMTSFTIPESVTRIGNCAFFCCTGLTSVTIPASVTGIGAKAFFCCTGLTSVTIPTSVTGIGDQAFEYCSSLQKLYLPRRFQGETTRMSIPSKCSVVFYDNPILLSVFSGIGKAIPYGRDIQFGPKAPVSCVANSPSTDPEESRIRYVCTGWTGTGSAPASGTGTNATFTIAEPSTLTWHWETNVWIECSVSGDAVGSTNGWFQWNGEAVVVPLGFVPALWRCSVSGDADDVVVDRSARAISIPANRPHSLAVTVEEVTPDRAVDGVGAGVVLSHPSTSEPWFSIDDMTAQDGFCLRSGEVSQGGTSVLETIVTGPGRLSFSWRIAANRSDYARFYVNDSKQVEITRTAAWTTNELDIAAGEHTLRWTFERGSAAGGTAFLDDVRWIPDVSFTVASVTGTPVPVVGTHVYSYGDEITAYVAALSPANGTRHVCTGWTGTGNVPEEGTGTNVTFSITGDSSLTWNWQRQHWIDVKVTSGGSTTFTPQWFAEGTTASVALSPNWTLYDIVLTGDTNGVTRSGAMLIVPVDGPRTIRVMFTERKVSLTVATPMGTVVPAPGVHEHSYGDIITASAVSPLSEAGGIQIVCDGWSGTGSVPSCGLLSSVSFGIAKDTSITWKWATNVWLDVAVSGDGSIAFSPQWVRKGSTQTISIYPSTHLHDISLSGDVADGVSLSDTTLTVVADRPRTIRVAVAERKLSLTVVSVHGETTPLQGTHEISWGTVVAASVAEPEPTNGVRYVCEGWTGTGNVPAVGTGTNTVFTVEEDSSLEWNWRTNVWIALEARGCIATDFGGAGWVEKDTGNMVVAYETLAPDCILSLDGDTWDVAHDEGAKTLTIPTSAPHSLTLSAKPLSALTLADALDTTGFVWISEGGNAWKPQISVTHDGADAAESGDASGGDSILETTLTSPGTLSWSWMVDANGGGAGIDLEVDGSYATSLEEYGVWRNATHTFDDADGHSVRFVFWNENGDESYHAYLDQVQWTGSAPSESEAVVVDGVAVPRSYFDCDYPALLAVHGGDYATAANATAANGVNKVWECYVAGICPTNAAERFVATIEMMGDRPVVRWSPPLPAAEEAKRSYRILGRRDVGPGSWDDVTTLDNPGANGHRYFKATVEMAEDAASGSDAFADGFPESVTITLDANGGDVSPTSLVYTAPGTLSELPTPTNYGQFLGWFSRPAGGVRFTPDTIVPWMDMTLTARWVLDRYTITFDSTGGSDVAPITQDYSTTITAPEDPTREGYTFAGWSPTLPATMPATNVTLTAQWTANRYTISFDSAGGSAISPITQDYGTAITAPAAPTKEGYAFAGWVPAIPATMPATNKTLTAQWMESGSGLSIRYYDISSSGYSTWMQSEESMNNYFACLTPTIATNTLAFGETLDVGFTSSLGKDGESWVAAGLTRPSSSCSFHGGYGTKAKNNFAAFISGSLHLSESETYQFAAVADDAVVLYIDGNMVLENGSNWGTMATGEALLSTGYHTVSIGFYESSGGQGLSVQWKRTGETVWTPVPQLVLSHVQYTITFDSTGGSAVASITQDYGTAITAPEAPTREGYTFTGWSPALPATMPATYMTLTAQWTANQYMISFNTAGGGAVASITQDYGTAITAPEAPMREGYTFAGWSPALPATIPATNMVLTAQWTANRYTISFDSAGGSAVSAITQDYGTIITAPEAPTREGYIFSGWSPALPTTMPATNMTLTAQWGYPLYCGVDLSGGTSATRYPVSYLASPPENGFNTDEFKTTKLVLRRIEPGIFQMRGQYTTTLTKSYYIGVFEVTQRQYELVMGSNPSAYAGSMRPVEQVSYDMVRGSSLGAQWPSNSDVDENSFLELFRARTGLAFDLPTEAQWEYACRAGTTSEYNNGGNTSEDISTLGRWGYNRNDGEGGYSQHTTVGSYLPNAWGLYDMHGNVWEWCLDWRGDSLSSPQTDPVGQISGSDRAVRAGSWRDWDEYLYSSSTSLGASPYHIGDNHGFRLARIDLGQGGN